MLIKQNSFALFQENFQHRIRYLKQTVINIWQKHYQKQSIYPANNFLSIQNFDKKFIIASNFSIGSVWNLVSNYNLAIKPVPEHQIQLFLKLWKFSIKFSDLKLLHYILLTLLFNLHIFLQFQTSSLISKKQRKNYTQNFQINRVILLLISSCDKINQKQIIELIILVTQKISSCIVTTLSQKKKNFELTQTVQNLYLCQFVYLSKLQKFNEKQTTRMFNILTMLNQAVFFQRLINANLKQNFVWSFDSIIKPRRIQGICFTVFVNILLNLCTLQNSNAGIQLEKLILQLLEILTKRQLTINMVKFLTKKLQIVNQICPSKKWTVITKLMSNLLNQYSVSRDIIQFRQKNSYIAKKINNVQFPFGLIIKLKGESLPFKQQKILLQLCQYSKDKKLWITMRNYLKHQIILSFVSVQKNMIYGKEQKQFKWKQYKINNISIIIREKKIKLVLNDLQEKSLCIDHDFQKIDQIVLCDRQEGIGSTVSQLFQFKMIKYKIFQENQEQEVNLLQNQFSQSLFGKHKDTLKIFNCKSIFQDSFIKFMQTLGDLQLFFLILSHVIRKINDFQQLISMIRQILHLMAEFVIFKNVTKRQLSKQLKSQRRNSVLCLCWLCANLKKSAYIILQLMRFINIRSTKQIQEQIKFLCNFAFWKEFNFAQQKTLLFSIRQLLKQAINQESKPINTLNYCQRLLFQMIIFYKDSYFLINQRDECLKFHKLFLETVYQHIKDLIQFNKKRNKLFMLQIFRFLKFLMKLTACTLNQKLGGDVFDITFAIQLTEFLKLLSKLFYDYKQKKIISFSDIDAGLDQFFGSQQKGFIPLSINQTQTQQERFNIFLTFMVSESKSLITQFQVETIYYQQSKSKIYPIYQDQSIKCSQDKVKYNLLSFNIYLHMLTEKSWSYLLFLMPLKQYNEDLLQMIWKICFIYHISYLELKKQKVIKMLQNTPFPKNKIYLFKIFQLFLVKNYFQYQKGLYLFKVLNKLEFKKQIIQILQSNCENMFENQNQKSTQINLDKIQIYESFEKKKDIGVTKVYSTLYYLDILKYQDCYQFLKKLKDTDTYNNFKIVVYHIVLRSLIQEIKKHLKKNNRLSSIQAVEQRKVQVQTMSMINPSFSQHPKQEQQYYQQENTKQKMLSLQEIHQTINFYLNNLNVKNLKEHLKIQTEEQASAYLENYQINIEGILNTIKQIEKNQNQQNFRTFYFQKYVGFIQIHLISFSRHLIQKKINFQIKTQIQKQVEQASLLKSKRNKFMYKTIAIDLSKQSTKFFLQLSSQRRRQIYQIQKIWHQIQEKNRFFWNIFMNSQKYYSLSSITTNLGERFLLQISNKRPKLKLPTMGKSQSGLYSISLLSQKHGQDPTQQSQSTFFQECTLFKTQEDASEQCFEQLKNAQLKNTKSKSNKSIFKVYFITNQKIYQGTIEFVAPNSIKFTQNQYISELLYQRIVANKHQRRNAQQVQKNPKHFVIYLNQSSSLIYKKYLFFDIGLQISSQQRTNLFCFQNAKRRQLFCSNLKQYKQNIFNYPKIQAIIQKQSKRWSMGLISNFQYLMKINQFAGRSINDLSQYFIMPWTIAQFETQIITEEYLMNKNNFRDLSKPMGKVFQKKWNQIYERYTVNFSACKSQKQSQIIQPFLFGSFYSNPAIVANFLIRLNPYSTFHFQLQSNKFDHADRLFFSILQQYNSCKNNSSDMKQLIPQFYTNPEFLINRSNLNLGSRQNSDLVHDVKLPKWAKSAYEFIFKMKMFLQSPLITQSLHRWIDLIFGKYSTQKYALQADNLFLSQIYGPNEEELKKRNIKLCSSKKRESQKQQKGKVNEIYKQSKSNLTQFESKIYYYKEFGQISKCIFKNQHIPFALNLTIQKFNTVLQEIGHCKIDSLIESQYFFQQSQNIGMVAANKQFFLFQIQNNSQNQKIIWKQAHSLCSMQKLSYYRLINIKETNSNTNNNFLFYIKENLKLCCRQVKRSRFLKSLQIKDEQQLYECHLFQYLSNNVFVLAQKTFLKIIKFNCQISQLTKRKKMMGGKQTLMCEYPVFTQHKQKIIKIRINQQLNLIFSVDQTNKLFILKYSLKQITLLNSFQLKSFHFSQKITQMLIHHLSLIIILTNYNRLLVFNHLGDLIIAKEVVFNKNSKNFSEIRQKHSLTANQTALTIQLFNKQSSQIIVTTNNGNIWKFDLFQFSKSQVIKQKGFWIEKMDNKLQQKETISKIHKVFMERTGRHWKMFCLCEQTKNNKKNLVIKMTKNSLKMKKT